MSLKHIAAFAVAAVAPLFILEGARGVTIEVRVNNASSNDATEDSGGSMKLTEGEMKFEENTWMGLRFRNVAIPQGAYIKAAYVSFRASASASPTTAPIVYGQNAASASTFTSTDYNISTRSRTTASVAWSMSSWTKDVSYQTPSIKTIVQEIVNRSDWTSGNHLGILINTPTNGADRKTYSFDGNSSQAPLLHVEYVVVAAPVAKRLLFVVTSTSSPTAQESARRTIFQAFGYTVTLIAASASQASFDTAAAVNDVAYVSEEVFSSDLGVKLSTKSLGIVDEEQALSDELGMATSATNDTSTSLTIVKNTHFITAPFGVGSLAIFSSSQPTNAYLGTMAVEGNLLGEVNGANSLIVVEAGGALNDGTKATGRRVLLPWGGGAFDFDRLSDDGIILLSRTLAWAGGLVGWWKLDETSGSSANDSSVNLKHAALTGFTFGTSATSGKVAGALAFDGSTDHVSTPNASVFQLTKALSVSAWIKGDAWGAGTTVGIILRKGEDNPNNWQLSIQDGYVALGLDGNDGSNARGATLLTTGVWHHVVGSWDGSTIRIYLDGVLDNVPVARSAPINTDSRPVYLGGYAGADYLDGVLDDVRLFNHALYADEVSILKTQGQSLGVRVVKWIEAP